MSALVYSRTRAPIGNDCTFQVRLVALSGSGPIVANEGNAIAQIDVATISCTVYDLGSNTPSSPVATPAIDSSVITDLVADDFWSQWDRPKDTIGRNFLHTVAGSVFSQPHTYRVVYSLTLADSTSLTWAHEVEVEALTS